MTTDTVASQMQADDPAWPFAAGLADAVETPEPVECAVQGKLPPWLAGALFRAGPGVFAVQTQGRTVSLRHWFDGVSLVHRFEIAGGRVWYRSKLAGREYLETAEKTGDLGMTFGGISDPCQTLYQRAMAVFIRNDKINVNVTISPNLVVPIAAGTTKEEPVRTFDTICAIKTDGNFLQEIDPTTLQPKAAFSYKRINDKLEGFVSCAHEEYDPITGSFFNFVAKPGATHAYTVFEVNKEAPTGTIIGKFDLPDMHYMHSFSSTKKYVVMQLWPVTYGWKGTKLLWTRNIVDSFNWDPESLTRFVVIDRAERKVVAHYQYPAAFCFHTINAFDDADTGDIVMDMCLFKDASVIRMLDLEHLRSTDSKLVDEARQALPAVATRLRLAAVADAIRAFNHAKPAPLAEMPRVTVDFEIPGVKIELPRINETKRHDQSYRFVYGISDSARASHSHVMPDSIAKIDMSTRSHVAWSKTGHTPGEPVFIKNPTGTDEDDGVLLTVVLNGPGNCSELVVLDAKTMKEVAVATLPRVVPYGFHGSFVKAA